MAPWSLHARPLSAAHHNAQKALEYRQRKGQPIKVYESSNRAGRGVPEGIQRLGAVSLSATLMELRPYQLGAIDRYEKLKFADVKAPLFVAPTGSGKTIIAAEIIRRAEDQRTLFMAPRRELIHQTCRKLDDIGVSYGVLLAGDRRTNLYSSVQVASRDTLISRLVRSRKYDLAPFHNIIIDEAHVSVSPTAPRHCWRCGPTPGSSVSLPRPAARMGRHWAESTTN